MSKARALQAQKKIMNAMKDMFRDVIQQVMESELETELGYEKSARWLQGSIDRATKQSQLYSQKTVKTQLGEIDVKVPRDRIGKYEPQIIGKYSRNADGVEEKILALFSCGMSQRDIAEQIKNLYGTALRTSLAYALASTRAANSGCLC